MRLLKNIYIAKELKFNLDFSSFLFIKIILIIGEMAMKSKIIFYGILMSLSIFLLLVSINTNNKNKEVKKVIEQNVISAKYEEGFIVIELESDRENCSTIERYDISLVTIKYNDEEKSYVNKYFNGYGKLKEVILFYNGEIL